MEKQFEPIVLSNLIVDEEYMRKVLPFLKEEYFEDQSERLVFKLIFNFIGKYNTIPSKEALQIDLGNTKGIGESVFARANEVIEKIEKKDVNGDWLIDNTELFCQEKALFNALKKSLDIFGDDKQPRTGIPKILQDALGVSFDTNIGHDYIENYKERFEYYHRKEIKISFDIDWLNLVTAGGVSQKTLNIFSAGTGVGKSFAMCHFAAFNLMCGHNVLYITLEMSEEECAKRIDSNLLDIPIADIIDIPWDIYDKKMEGIRPKATGKIIIKEYPTAAAGASNFRYLMNDLYLKKAFHPEIVYVDYLNICSSSRVKLGNTRHDLYIKGITEELRGLAQEFCVPIITGSQFNREGFASSDPGLENLSDAFSSSFAADFTCAMVRSEELDALGQLLFKQTGKNRYYDFTKNTKAAIGIDRAYMRLYNVEQSAQENIVGANRTIETKSVKKFDKEAFADFK